MPVSLARTARYRSIAGLVAAIGLTLSAPGTARAQAGPPVRLAPAGAPVPATPAPAVPTPSTPYGQPLHPLAPPGITVDQLAAPSLDALGEIGRAHV